MTQGCLRHPDKESVVVEHRDNVSVPMCRACWDDHRISKLGHSRNSLVDKIMGISAPVTIKWKSKIEHDGICSVQYKVDRADWEAALTALQMRRENFTKMGIGFQYEQLVVDGNPVYHLELSPTDVKCVRRQNGLWLTGHHHAGHCPAIIYGEEIEVMAKNQAAKKEAPKKTEVKTAQLGPKSHVADPEPTKTKRQRKAEPRPCSCGCNQMTGGGYFFPGHDAKVKSMFKKLEEGTLLKKDAHTNVLKMYALWLKNKSTMVKDLAKEVLG